MTILVAFVRLMYTLGGLGLELRPTRNSLRPSGTLDTVLSIATGTDVGISYVSGANVRSALISTSVFGNVDEIIQANNYL